MLREHEWDLPEFNGDHDWDLDSDDDGKSDEQRAADEFMEILLHEYFSGVITAIVFCQLCHWACKGKSSVGEAAAPYALPPGRTSGKYKSHLDEKLEFRSKRRHMYHFDVPGRQRHSEDRCSVTIAARLIRPYKVP